MRWLGLLLALGWDATNTVEAPPAERVSVPPVVDPIPEHPEVPEEVTVVIEDIAALHALEATHSLDQVLPAVPYEASTPQRPSTQWVYAHHLAITPSRTISRTDQCPQCRHPARPSD